MDDMFQGITGLAIGSVVGGIGGAVGTAAFGGPWWLQIVVGMIGVPVGASIGSFIDVATEGARFRR